MKLTKHLAMLTVLLVGICTMSCSKNDEPDNGTGREAWTGSKTIEGTKVDFYVSSDRSTGNCRLIMFYGDTYREKEFIAVLGSYAEVSVYMDGSSIVLRLNSDYTITLRDGSTTVILSPTNPQSYWQMSYDKSKQLCIEYYQQYVTESVRYPELALMAAKNQQEWMKRIHLWAQEDGISLTLSEWETKNLEIK